MRRLVPIAVTVVVLAALAGGYWLLTTGGGGGGGGAGPGGGGGPPAMAVEATQAVRGAAIRRLHAVGTLLSNNSVIVRPEIPGRVAEIRFEDGAEVAAGQVLVVLDRAIAEAELAQARASLTLAQQAYQRATELLARGAGTARARDEAQATLRNDQAQLDLASARLDRTILSAPWPGVAGLRRVSVGDYVAAGQDIVNLEQMRPIKIEFRLPQRFLRGLVAGQAVTLASDAWPGQTFEATIRAIDPRIDPDSRSILVQATAPNDDLHLRPGQFVAVTVRVAERQDAIFVPEQALVPQGDHLYVYRIVDDRAVRSEVTAGLRIATQVEIVSGLAAGDRVVTAGQQRLGDGVPVRASEPVAVPPRPADEEIEVQAGF